MRPTVTWEGEVQVTCKGEVKCNQLLHGRERSVNCYMGGRGKLTTVTWEGEVQ